MKDPARERYPGYVPRSYRAFLRVRKLYRQTAIRLQERLAARQATSITEEPMALVTDGAVSNPPGAINKCVRWMEEDLARPDIKAIVDQLVALKAELTRRGLRFTNTAGNFLAREYHPEHERGKLWENAWVVRHSGVQAGEAVLDVGGASTIFSCYLAGLGCRVDIVDNDWSNCGTIFNASYVAKRMGWRLRARDRDVSRPLPFAASAFDRVFSICVLEHLPSSVRQFLMREIGRVLRPGGTAGLTFDYDATRPVLITDRGLRYGQRATLERDVIRPSGLSVIGNTDWIDACPPEGFMGCLLLRKAAAPLGAGAAEESWRPFEE